MDNSTQKESSALSGQSQLPEESITPNEVVRPEYNIGRFVGLIFVSPYARDVREERSYRWDIEYEGESMRASLTIVPSLGGKTPTTTTLRVFLALLQVWEHQGKPADGSITFSARHLCHVIGWRWSGRDSATRINEHLTILSRASLNWVFSFRKANGDLEQQYSDMSILQTNSYRERQNLLKSEKFMSVQQVRFNSDLVANMLHGHVRPINYRQFQRIANDAAASLYTRLDLYLSKKTHWERRALPLFREELGLAGKRYSERRIRLQRLKGFVKELDGAELLHGKLSLAIEETADGADWKLVARKIPRIDPPKRNFKPLNSQDDAEVLAEEVIADIACRDRADVPRRGYIVFLCRMYPQSLIRRALATAKADYQGIIRTSLVRVFVFELRRMVEEAGLKWHSRNRTIPILKGV